MKEESKAPPKKRRSDAEQPEAKKSRDGNSSSSNSSSNSSSSSYSSSDSESAEEGNEQADVEAEKKKENALGPMSRVPVGVRRPVRKQVSSD